MFEFFFKYPRSLYARGQFALLGAWPKWILVLLMVAAAAGLAGLIHSRLQRAAPVMRSWRAWVIWGLQTLLAALICRTRILKKELEHGLSGSWST